MHEVLVINRMFKLAQGKKCGSVNLLSPMTIAVDSVVKQQNKHSKQTKTVCKGTHLGVYSIQRVKTNSCFH